MNKHLLNTRLRSLDHYKNEIQKLNNAKLQTQQTRNDILQSLSEFITWPPESVLIIRDKIFKFLKVTKVADGSNNDLFFILSVCFPNGEGGFFNGSREMFLNVEDLEACKIIYEPKTADDVKL